MKCEKCGIEIESGIVYCPNCGQSIQLVPNYNVLEEELLSALVEDKDNPNKDKFAEGVYTSNANDKSFTNQKQESSRSAFYKHRKFLISMLSVLIIVIIGIIFVARYSYTHTFDYYLKQAQEAENNGKYGVAKDYYEKAVNIDELSFDAIFGLGRAYYNVKDYNNAIDMLKKALEIEPENIEIYQYLCDSYTGNSNVDSIKELAQNSPNDEITNLIGNYIIIPPSFSVEGGEYNDYVTLTLYSTADSQIFYSTDGKDPTKSGKKYTSPIEIKEGETTVKAVSKNSQGKYSDIVTHSYTINYAGPSTPVVTPAGGTFTEPTMITIDVPSNADAYYTWDASMPDTNSFMYTGPINVIQGKHILTVIYIDNHGNKSNIFRAQYNYN